MDKAKTAILVTFFTVLIWVLAEGESLQTTRTEADVTFPAATTEAYAVRLAEGEVLRAVELVVEGPTASLDGLESALRRPVTLAPGNGVPRESGEHTIQLRDALREHELFRSRGVTVLSAEPPTVRVVIEELTTRQFPIRVEAPTEELDGPPQVVGSDQASVRLPARVVASLPEGAEVVARVRSEDLASVPEGVRSTVQVRLEAGPGLSGAGVLGIQPAQVGVQLTVRSKTETVVIPSMRVDVRGQLDQLAAWEITVDPPDLQNVRVTGPGQLIRKLGPEGGLVVRPFVWVAYDELREGTLTKRVQFTDFPDDPMALNLRFEVEDQEVVLTMRRREADGGAPEGSGPE